MRALAVLAVVCLVGLPISGAGAEVVRRQMPVPTLTIYPGDTITASVVTEKRFRLRRKTIGSYVMRRTDLEGKVARRTLMAGRPIPRNAVRESNAVVEGSQVTLIYTAQGLVITGLGKAIQSGAVGEFISVQNVDSGRVVRGRVREDGAVDVGGR